MTVAAVILAASPASALADAAGTPAARRLADVAWAGGATPVVVCSFDPDGTVAAAAHASSSQRLSWRGWTRKTSFLSRSGVVANS